MAYEHMTDDVTWPPKVLWVRSAILATAWLLVSFHVRSRAP